VLFLYKAVLAIEIGGVPPVVRARTPERLPVVLSRDEVTALLKPLAGTMRLVVTALRRWAQAGGVSHASGCPAVCAGSQVPHGATEWGWQFVFPATRICRDRAAHPETLFRDALLEAGYDIRTVQELLGHRDVRTTMTYLHVLERGALGVKSPLDWL
jgi:integrase